MQTLNYTTFWNRYGQTKHEQTPLAKALARLPNVTPNGPWLAGGAVRRHIMDLPQDSDYDFFFQAPEQFGEFCSAMTKLGAARLGENEFNVAFKLPAKDKEPELLVQAIRIAYYPTLADVLESFDFSLCQTGFDGESLVLGDFTLFDLARRRLVPGRISYGVSSLRRMLKYTKQGYYICGGGLTNMLEQIIADPAVVNSKVQYID